MASGFCFVWPKYGVAFDYMSFCFVSSLMLYKCASIMMMLCSPAGAIALLQAVHVVVDKWGILNQ